jgi:hypothetical protein
VGFGFQPSQFIRQRTSHHRFESGNVYLPDTLSNKPHLRCKEGETSREKD